MKPFTLLGAVIFALVSLAHLLRLVFGWSILINGMSIPAWMSIVGCIVPALLALMLWREGRR
jgi:hypothetical protein